MRFGIVHKLDGLAFAGHSADSSLRFSQEFARFGLYGISVHVLVRFYHFQKIDMFYIILLYILFDICPRYHTH